MRVHRNLNRACWTTKATSAAKVVHVDAVALRGVRFVVSAKGRARVLAQQVRMVHAYAAGEPVAVPDDTAGLVKVTYNPYRAGAFVRTDTGAAVEGAELAVFTAAGECLCRF